MLLSLVLLATSGGESMRSVIKEFADKMRLTLLELSEKSPESIRPENVDRAVILLSDWVNENKRDIPMPVFKRILKEAGA